MAKDGQKYKIKLLKIYEILKNNTDEQHKMSSVDLLKRLKDENIPCDRKVLYEDIKLLIDNGCEVYCERKKQNFYWAEQSNFEEAELKILIDAVQAAKFVPLKKTETLTKRIAGLAGSYKSVVLKQTSRNVNKTKTINDAVIYSVDSIYRAIYNKKKIEFKYFDLTPSGNKVYRREGDVYIENPIELIISKDNYYLFVYNEKYNDVATYRVDRMSDVFVDEEDMVCSSDVTEKINKIKTEVFSMYTGEEKRITLEYDKKITNVLIDQFGLLKYEIASENTYRSDMKVMVSNEFFAWCAALNGKVKIVAPKDVMDKYKKFLQEALENFEK